MPEAPPREASLTDAYEIVHGRPDARLFLTCEHASERLPEGYAWPEADARLVGTHWAFDLGARDLTLELAEALGAPAVLSRFSRLLVDPNRPEGVDTLFRADAEGAPVALNIGLDADEAERRLARFHRPYHDAVDAQLGASRAPVLLSIHSFTPVYEGAPRAMELGVLFDQDEPLALALHARLSGPFVAALNEPYSGRAGLIYAAERHAITHGRRALELEVRQDLAVQPAFRRRLISVLVGFTHTLMEP